MINGNACFAYFNFNKSWGIPNPDCSVVASKSKSLLVLSHRRAIPALNFVQFSRKLGPGFPLMWGCFERRTSQPVLTPSLR
jgi:hypothetical protein